MDARTRPTVGVVTPDLLGTSSGLEFLRGIIDGKHPVPPIADLVGFSLTEVDFGRVVFQSTPEFKHYNPLGTVHGGYAATLLDSCMGCCVHSTLPVGVGLHHPGVQGDLDPGDHGGDRAGHGGRPHSECRPARRDRRGTLDRRQRPSAGARDHDVSGL
jgi:Domain of unknown function (DUF4442)